MRLIRENIVIVFVAFILSSTIVGCSSRVDTPIVLSDSTIFYPLKDKCDTTSQITLCRKTSSKTDAPIGEASGFTIMDKENVKALFAIGNSNFSSYEKQLYHIYWIGPDNKSIYRKKILVTQDDSLNFISSSISIDADRRTPGDYKVRVYFYRELVAEKSFKLFPEFNPETVLAETSSLDIFLEESKDQVKTSSESSQFELDKSKELYASCLLPEGFVAGNRELRFKFEWSNYESEIIKMNTVDLLNGYKSILLSDISLNPSQLDTGNYMVRLFLFDKEIARKSFSLKEKKKEKVNAKANITFYSKKSKSDGKLIGKGTEFNIGDKSKVRAMVTISKLNPGAKLNYILKWVGPDSKTVYKKEGSIDAGEKETTIYSSISIPASKRQPGNYKLKVYVSGILISEKGFSLK